MEKNAAHISFESAMRELEQIVEKLNQSDLSLENALEYFEKGISLAKQCQKTLKDADIKVQKLIDQAGLITEQPFEEAAQ